MANRVKKLQVDLNVQTKFTNALKQIEVFKKQLDSLALPKNLSKSLEKSLSNYQTDLQKLLNFKPTSQNLDRYRTLIESLGKDFSNLSSIVMNAQQQIDSVFESDQATVLNYIQQYNKLKEEIIQGDKAVKAYYGVTSTDSLKKQKAAIDKKAAESEKLTGAAAEASAKKQERLTTTLKETIKKRQQFTDLEEKINITQQKNVEAYNSSTQAVNNLNRSFTQINSPLNVAEENLSNLNKELIQLQTQDTSNQLFATLKQITALGVAFNYARQQLVKMKDTYLELDNSLTQIAVVSGKTRDEMWSTIGAYNEMAQRLGTTTTQVVEASKLYYQQGRSQSEVMELVEQTSILATISELEFADATNYLTAAINGFQLEATDAANITDIWANLAAKAAVDTQELAIAISKVASIAKSAGADIETTSAFLTKMINFATYTRVA